MAPERGGSPDDTQNLVSLVKEMRAAFGSTYGISLTLAPDYWYLRYFDAKAMESSVDFFGFMAYGESTPHFLCIAHGLASVLPRLCRLTLSNRSPRLLGQGCQDSQARRSWPGRHSRHFGRCAASVVRRAGSGQDQFWPRAIRTRLHRDEQQLQWTWLSLQGAQQAGSLH